MPSGGHSIAKIGAGHCTLDSFRAPGAVPLSGPHRHVERTGRGGDQLAVGLTVIARLQTIRIAETARLHLRDRSIYARFDRTALEFPCVNQHGTSAAERL